MVTSKYPTWTPYGQSLGKRSELGPVRLPLSVRPTREQRIDWAYGNTKIENSDVTREMVERAVDEKLAAGK